MPSTATLLWLQNPVFSAAGARVCAELARAHPSRLVEAGEVFVEAGALADAVFVLLGGTAQVVHCTGGGREVVAKLLRAPGLIGDVELLNGLRLISSVRAVEDSSVALLPGEDYLEFLASHPAAMLAHLRHLAAISCVAALNERQVFANAEERIANLFLAYSEIYGRAQDDAILIGRPLSQQQIAQSVGLVRRSVAHVLSTWARAGIVARRGSLLAILDLPRLESMARPLRGSLCYQMGRRLAPASSAALPVVELEVLAGAEIDRGRRYAVDGEVLIGRQPPCSLLLSDPTVSRVHCRVHRGATGVRYWLEDLQSASGTRLDDRSVQRGVLHDGSLIKLGETVLRFSHRPRSGRHQT